jgi:hypothetical protein
MEFISLLPFFLSSCEDAVRKPLLETDALNLDFPAFRTMRGKFISL